MLGAFDADLLDQSMQAGADYFLVKPVSAAQCLATLTRAAHGPTTVNRETHQWETFCRQLREGVRLSRREQAILRCLIAGRLYKEIAPELQISEALVRKHTHKIYQKLQVHNRSEAIGVWLNGKASLNPDPGS